MVYEMTNMDRSKLRKQFTSEFKEIAEINSISLAVEYIIWLERRVMIHEGKYCECQTPSPRWYPCNENAQYCDRCGHELKELRDI